MRYTWQIIDRRRAAVAICPLCALEILNPSFMFVLGFIETAIVLDCSDPISRGDLISYFLVTERPFSYMVVFGTAITAKRGNFLRQMLTFGELRSLKIVIGIQ